MCDCLLPFKEQEQGRSRARNKSKCRREKEEAGASTGMRGIGDRIRDMNYNFYNFTCTRLLMVNLRHMKMKSPLV